MPGNCNDIAFTYYKMNDAMLCKLESLQESTALWMQGGENMVVYQDLESIPLNHC